jgi:modulator of FtsH protease
VVAISVNLARILETPQLPGRAAEALVLLASAMVVTSVALVPDQPDWLLGAEVLCVGVVTLVGPLVVQARAMRHRYTRLRNKVGRAVLSTIVSLPPIAAGAIILGGAGGGLYWLAGGVILSLVSGLISAWVLLVEIIR